MSIIAFFERMCGSCSKRVDVGLMGKGTKLVGATIWSDHPARSTYLLPTWQVTNGAHSMPSSSCEVFRALSQWPSSLDTSGNVSWQCLLNIAELLGPPIPYPVHNLARQVLSRA